MIKLINNRELSWLSFNERVLREALDESNPLLERLNFVAIYSSNMDEFFMVRVSGIRQQISVHYDQADFSGLTPHQKLKEIVARTRKMDVLQQQIFSELKSQLDSVNIHFPALVDGDRNDTLETIFIDEIMPVISPVTIDPSHPFPFIYNKRICLVVEMVRKDKKYTSLIMIPETLSRIYKIKKGRTINIYTVEDIICRYTQLLYKGYDVQNVSIFRVTRDADLDMTEEQSDLLKSIEHSLSKRKRGDVNRVEISGDLSPESYSFLKKMVGFTDDAAERVNGTIDLTFLFGLHSLNDTLIFPKLEPRKLKRKIDGTKIFDEVKKQPIYLFRPYNSFSVVTDFIAQAAVDKDVLAIKMTLYRTNKDSHIIASLLEAAKRGKQVTVVVELKARFDEERNIEWAKNLEKAGCIVTYGIVGLKIHAKCTLIVRKEGEKIVRYTHVGTGNYNENTAKVYTDIDLITAEPGIGRDATKLFNYLTGFTEEDGWSRMSLAPFDLRKKVISMIDKEIEFAKKGKKTSIIMKMNALIDEAIIEKLYEASSCNVNIALIVRGVCGLKPGMLGVSENIRVISVVGRFLEHARIMYFHHGGEENIFITSADMMQRNLNGRVEIMVNIVDKKLKKSLTQFLNISLKDNCKAWELKEDTYTKLTPKDGEERINSQEFFLHNDF